MNRSILIALTIAVATSVACKKKEPQQESGGQTAIQADEQADSPDSATAQAAEVEPKPEEVPDDAMGPGTERQQQLLIRAKSAFLNEQWDEAEARFKELTETGPISGPQVTAYIALGQLYNDDDRGQAAMELYEELKEKAPETPEVHFVLARTLAEQGETTKAIRAYQNTIKLQPDYVQAMVELGGLYAKSGREEDAERMLYNYEKKIYKLSEALESSDTTWEEKLKLLEIFSFVDDDRANQAIAKTILDPHPAVRERAIWLAVDLQLGAIRPNLEVLAANDPDRRVRLAAKEALQSLKDAPTTGSAPTMAK